MKEKGAIPGVVDVVARECLAVRVRLINRVITALYDEAMRPHGLRVSQGNIMIAVAHRVETRPSELCRMLRIEKSTLSRDVELMKQEGWMESDPPSGGRNQKLRLTPKGIELIRKVQPAWEQAQARALELIGDSGAIAIHEMASRLGFGQLEN
jgi:DNA-binding MarR family transcriptional regulator